MTLVLQIIIISAILQSTKKHTSSQRLWGRVLEVLGLRFLLSAGFFDYIFTAEPLRFRRFFLTKRKGRPAAVLLGLLDVRFDVFAVQLHPGAPGTGFALGH